MKDYSNKIWTIPNVISLFRLLLVPVIAFFLWRENYLVSLILVVISAVSDMVDGFIARKFHMVSNVGRVLDPIADKITQIVILLMLAYHVKAMIIPAIILFVKELLSGFVGIFVAKKTKRAYNAEWHGKVTTILVYGTAIAHLVFPDMPEAVSWCLIGACVVMMLLSFVLYLLRYKRIIRSLANGNAEIEENPETPPENDKSE